MIGLFKKIFDVVDQVVPDSDNRDALKARIQSETVGLYEKEISARAAVLQTEMAGNWLQKSWRPLTMLAFVCVVLKETYIPSAVPINAEIWEIVKIGLGGYVGGRSVEKITDTIVTRWKK